MKKTIITLLAAILLPLTANAQYKLMINYSDGTQKDTIVWDVESISFEEISPRTLEGIPAPTAIDLGLPNGLKWADMNLGAKSPADVGWLVGWGDVTGMNESKNLKYFPAPDYTNDIYETAYDIVHAKLEGEWRLPVASEIQQLIDNCTWESSFEDAVPGFRVTADNGNSIFLPFTGYRNGRDTLDVDSKGLYWTGTIAEDNPKATALLLNGGVYKTVDSLRYLGFAIRPVYGKFVHDLTIVASPAENITYLSATIPVEVLGDMSQVDKLGICFNKQSETVNPMAADAPNNRLIDIEEGASKFNIEIENLEGKTSYKAIAYLKLEDGSYIFSDTVRFATLAKYPVAEEVDLGLSVNWASFNMGETVEEGNTHLYGWGDETGDLRTTWANDYAKYLSYSSTTIAGNEDFDIAAHQWRDGWRLPTREEFQELYTNPNMEYTGEMKNGIYGYRFTNKKNGNSIFIPCCGARNGTDILSPGSCWYWTAEATYNNTDGWRAYYAYLFPSSVDIKQNVKYLGMGIRPVRANADYSGGGSGNNSGGDNGGNDNTGGDSSDDSGNTGNDNPSPTYTEKPGVAVDLGLTSNVLWADRNLGASSATDAGGYYAWGDVIAHTNGYDKYQYYDESTKTYINIGGSISGTSYDAARETWGGKWRMPTIDEIEDLISKCTWNWKESYNGVAGYEVVGSNGKTIFLPAAGTYSSSHDSNLETIDVLYNYNEIGSYWSSTAWTKNPVGQAQMLNIKASGATSPWGARNVGRCIRPVRDR